MFKTINPVTFIKCSIWHRQLSISMKQSIFEPTNIIACFLFKITRSWDCILWIYFKLLTSKFKLHTTISCNLVIFKITIVFLSIRPSFASSSMDSTFQDFSFVDFSWRPFKHSLTRGKTLLPLSIIDRSISKSFDSDTMFEIVDKSSFEASCVVLVFSQPFKKTVFPSSFIIRSLS